MSADIANMAERSQTGSEAGRLLSPRSVAAGHVVVETTACLPEDVRRRYGIAVVPIPFVFGHEAFLDGVDLTPTQFYERLIATRTVPKTSPPSPGEYLEVWRAAAQGTGAVIAVTVDSKVSTLQRSTLLARDLAPQMLPGTRIEVVDSLSAGMGQGFVALAAARALAGGATVDEAVAAARAMADRVQMIVTLDTLEYLAKTSRIPQVAAFFGGILDLKPIIKISNGEIEPIGRVRTRRRSIEALRDHLRAHAPGGGVLHAAVQHARAEAEAARLAATLRDEYPIAELYTTEFTPVMGGYCGPGLLGIAYYFDEK